MSIELKIKLNSLAAESRIIKNNERRFKRACNPRRFASKSHERLTLSEEERVAYKAEKAKRIAAMRATQWSDRARSDFNKIYLHRVLHVQPEARATHLARMFIKGAGYYEAEQTTRDNNLPQLDRIVQMVSKYSTLFDEMNSAERMRQVVGWCFGIPPFEGWQLCTVGLQPEHNGLIDVIVQNEISGELFQRRGVVAGNQKWALTEAELGKDVNFVVGWRPHNPEKETDYPAASNSVGANPA